MSEIDFRAIRQNAGPFPVQAYQFVRDGLAHTVRVVHGEGEGAGGQGEELSGGAGEISRHVSGRQLCLGLKDYAHRQYGQLAKTVLNRWHIRETEDFGRIVFAMIDAKLMHKTEEDSIEDFRNVYDFDAAFADLMPPGSAGSDAAPTQSR